MLTEADDPLSNMGLYVRLLLSDINLAFGELQFSNMTLKNLATLFRPVILCDLPKSPF